MNKYPKTIILLLLIFLPTICYSQHKVIPGYDSSADKIGPSVWNESNFSRTNALGGCGINLVDEHSGFFNPGALGLFHLNKILSFSFPNGTKYLPDINDDARRNTISISGGISYRLFKPSSKSDFNMSLAFAYIRDRWESGVVKTYDYSGYETTAELIELNNQYSISIAVDGFVRFGAGYMIISPTSEYYISNEPVVISEAKDRHGFGFILERSFTLKRGSGLNDQHISLMPSIAFTRGDIKNIYAVHKESKLGFSLNLIFNAKNHNQLSLRTILEYDKPDNYLASYYDYYLGYTYTYTVEYEWRHKLGAEIGLYDILSLRFGKIEGLDDMSFGGGLSVRGLIQYLMNRGTISGKNDFWHGLLRSLDVNFDYARVIGPFDRSINFMKFRVSF